MKEIITDEEIHDQRKFSKKLQRILRLEGMKIPDSDIVGNNSNTMASHASGPRLMLESQESMQGVNVVNPDVPILGFKHENAFGRSTSLTMVKAPEKMIFMRKFTKNTNQYTYLFKNTKTGGYTIEEQSTYMTVGGDFAIKCDDLINNLSEGSVIPKGDVLIRGSSFDQYHNYRSGKNMMTMNVNCVGTHEDAIIISESAAVGFTHYQVSRYHTTVNKREILLKKDENKNRYKCFSDIGETNQGINICTKRRTNDITAWVDMLDENLLEKDATLDDIAISGLENGVMVDIDVYINSDVNELRKHKYYDQMLEYYDNNMRYYQEFVDYIKGIIEVDGDAVLSPEIREKFITYRKILDGKIVIPGKGKKEFDNVYIEFSVLTKYVGIPGTKLAGRFAEKGVTGYVIPDDQMPITADGVRVDVILSSIAPFKRLIPGSLYEPEIGWIGREVIRDAIKNNYDRATTIDMVLRFVELFGDMDLDLYRKRLEEGSPKAWKEFIDYASLWGPVVEMNPLTNKLDIDLWYHVYNEVYPDLVPPAVYWNGIKLIETPIVGPKYFIVLEHTPDNKTSARNMGFVDPAFGPVKRKADVLLRDSSLGFGYMENDILSLTSCLADPNHAAIEFKYTNGGSRYHRENMGEDALEIAPKDIKIPKEEILKHPQDSVLALEAYGSANGIKFLSCTAAEAKEVIK